MAFVQNTSEFEKLRAAAKEMEVGKKAAHQLQGSLRNLIAIETVKHTGAMMRTRATAKADKSNGTLNRIVISSPHYSFKLNYGFEGVKSNGVSMRLPARHHLHDAIENTNTLNTLATEIGNIRADEVAAYINF